MKTLNFWQPQKIRQFIFHEIEKNCESAAENAFAKETLSKVGLR